MATDQPHQNNEELVDYKVRKRVAKKVMHDIHREVDDIEQQQKIEHKAAKILLPLILLLLVIFYLYTFSIS